MKIHNEIAQGVHSLLRHRLRTFLSSLGILFGVSSVIAMLAIGEGSKQEVLAQIEQLGTHHVIIRQSELSAEQQAKAREAKSHGLTIEDAHLLNTHIHGIQNVGICKLIKGSLRGGYSDLSPEILAINPCFYTIKGLELSEGRPICDLDCSQKIPVCLLGADIAKAFGKSGHVGQFIRIENISFKIVGVLDNKKWVPGKNKALSTRNLNKTIFLPLGFEKSFVRTIDQANDQLSEIIVDVEDSTAIAADAEAIKRLMEVRHQGIEDYQIIVPKELLKQIDETQKIFNLVLGGIAAISMLVGGIGIMNIMLAIVSDRTREIGIRRAVGATRFHIAKQFLIETLILTLAGAILGIMGGFFFSSLIGAIAGWTVIVTGWSICLSLSMAGFVGIISGLYPAIKAAKMDPIEALRHH